MVVVSVSLGKISSGKISSGERTSLFSLTGDGRSLRGLLASYGPQISSGYIIPLTAAWDACVSLQKRGVELRAKAGIPETLQAAAWRCEDKGLYPFQKIGAEKLRAHTRLILADQMGVGKTVQSLAALDVRKGALIFMPSVVLINWYNERKWAPGFTFRFWKRPYPLFPEPGEVNLVPYSQLPHDLLERRSRCPWCNKVSVVPLEDEEVAALAAKQMSWTDKCDSQRGGACLDGEGKPGVRRFNQREDAWPEWVWIGDKPKYPVQLIADEAHYLKSKDAQRTIAVRAIAAAGNTVSGSSTWLLTGTPLLNSPPELWSLCQLFPGQGGEYDDGAWDTFGGWSKFVEMFEGKKKMIATRQGVVARGYDWPGYASPEAKVCLSQVMLRRMRVDVLPDLPVKTRRYVDVDVNHKALSKMVSFTENDLLQFQNWTDDEVLAECEVGGALSMIRKELAALKLAMLVDLIKECEQVEEPVVVFSYHRDPIIELGMRKGWTCITGSTGAGERSAIVERFQRGELRGLAGTIGAMGVGVTLTKSSSVMFLDRDFVPANNLQAEDRAVRIGQTRGVIVTILNAKHPIDERVAIILERKEKLLEAMDLSEEGPSNEEGPPKEASL